MPPRCNKTDFQNFLLFTYYLWSEASVFHSSTQGLLGRWIGLWGWKHVEKFWDDLIISISTIMLHLMLVLTWIRSEGCHLVHHGVMERRGHCPSKSNQETIQTLGWKQVCKRMQNSKEKCCSIRHITKWILCFSASLKQNPYSCLQILQGLK